METILLELVNRWGTLGIALLIFIENLFPPIPSEAVLLFGGFLTTYTTLHPWMVIAAATVGAVAGACVLYAVGRLLSPERLKALLAGRLGRITRLKAEDVDKANAWFSKYEYKAVLFCRCVPIVRSLISIPAGMARMKWAPFLGLTTLGSALWNTVLVFAGAASGDAWENNLKYFDWYAKAALALFALLAAGAVWFYLKKRRSRAEEKARETRRRRRMAPGRVIALGFAAVILIGALLLFLPFTHNEGVDVTFTDALFTSTSAVCVTGLIAIDTADTFNAVGQTIVALLIQIGGLGVTSIGVGFIILSGRKINMRERLLAKEGLNYFSFKGVLGLVRSVLLTTLCFELAGSVLSFIVFSRDYPFWRALGISVFHSVAAFNNSGFDILGGFQNLIPYQNDVLLNLTTCLLILFGGLGFCVIRELTSRKPLRKFSLHSKVVLVTTSVLLVVGTVVLRLTDDVSWLGAFFHSTSARTAGFSTYPIGSFSNAGLLVLTALMFIGASPGSTGGGIKTTTFFVIVSSLFSSATNQSCGAFRRSFPRELRNKAFTIAALSVGVVFTATFALCVLEPGTEFLKLLFETVSAFGTVGLSTGITPGLADASKWVITLTMYIGRLGPLTVASLWVFRPDSCVDYAEESVTIG